MIAPPRAPERKAPPASTIEAKRPWRRAALVVGVLITLVAGALIPLVAGCRRDRKPPVRVQKLEGESSILPRDPRGPSDPSATRASLRSIRAGGRERRYALVEPADVAADRRYPLILVFHGDGGDAMTFHDAWPFERATGKDAFIAYPEGAGGRWDLETTANNQDEQLAVAIIDEVASRHPIDRERIFATGYSSGGFMANVLACHRPGLLRAISSNAGGAPYNQLEKWGNGYPRCPGQSPVAMLALHGERDGTVSLDSGRFSAEYWAYVNGCDTETVETTGYPQCHAYRGCPAGKAVGFCSIPALGHWLWEDAAQTSWSFFERQ